MPPLAPPPRLTDRAAGVLLHPTSLPGHSGVGDLGPVAHRFLDFVGRAGLSWWQMLPLSPVGYGNSPYSALSAFGSSSLLLSLE
jgi:4-alpha-glucanotransferase